MCAIPELQTSFHLHVAHFRFNSENHLGRINAAKHIIEHIQPDTAPIESAPYRDGTKTRQLGIPKIDKS